jgi:hypothetical protein
MRKLWLATAVCFVGWGTALASTPAWAESAADGAPTEEARARFREGVRFYDHGKYEQARVAFLQAYALTSHSSILMNLAWSCLKSGHFLEAEKYFKRFMSESKEMTDKQIADATEGLNQSQSHLGRLEVQAPAGATLLVDGAGAGTAPLAEPIELEAGHHTAQVKDADAADVQSVVIVAGRTAQVTLRGKAVAAAPPPAEPAETSTSPEHDTAEESSAEGAHARVEAPPANHPGLLAVPRNVVPAIVVGGLALAGYGTAIGFFLAKQSATSSRSQNEAYINGHLPPSISSFSCNAPPTATLASECSVINKENDEITADALVANIALGVGLAATAGVIIYWLAAEKRGAAPTTGVVVTPIVGSGVGGLSLAGQF